MGARAGGPHGRARRLHTGHLLLCAYFSLLCRKREENNWFSFGCSASSTDSFPLQLFLEEVFGLNGSSRGSSLGGGCEAAERQQQRKKSSGRSVSEGTRTHTHTITLIGKSQVSLSAPPTKKKGERHYLVLLFSAELVGQWFLPSFLSLPLRNRTFEEFSEAKKMPSQGEKWEMLFPLQVRLQPAGRLCHQSISAREVGGPQCFTATITLLRQWQADKRGLAVL